MTGLSFLSFLGALAAVFSLAFGAAGDWTYHGTAGGLRSGGASWNVVSSKFLYILGGKYDAAAGAISNDFGVWNFSNPQNPVWDVLSASAYSWSAAGPGAVAPVSGASPGGRSVAVSIVDTVSNASDIRLWLYGGSNATSAGYDLWYYSVASMVRSYLHVLLPNFLPTLVALALDGSQPEFDQRQQRLDQSCLKEALFLWWYVFNLTL